MEKENKKPHGIELNDRNVCSMSGVEKVISSSESVISIVTSCGGMDIFGKGLKIKKFDVSDGSFAFEGEIDSIKYSAPKIPLIKRIFK